MCFAVKVRLPHDDFTCLTGNKDDPNTTLVKGSTLGQPLESDECIAIASRWLEECISQSSYAHKYCPKIKSTHYPMPSRAINVGPADGSQEPYLQKTAGKAGQWVALSHCWGSAVRLNTTKDTLKLREQKIPFKDLPLSFQDAVTITRKLGYRHLWIDSLCIIQDSAKDWNLESGSMGHIYSNAVVCIAAEAAPDSSLGIFESSKRERFFGTGIAKEIRSRIGETYTYRAGLWQEDIHRGLLWSTKGQAIVGSQYSGPSWSWASVTWSEFPPSSIYNVEDTCIFGTHPGIFGTDPSKLSPLYSSSDTSIVSVVVEPSSSKKDPYLKIRSAALNLYGPTYSFDGLLDVSRPAFHQPSFKGFKRSEKVIGSVTYCELDLYKPELWTVSDLENRGIMYLQITKTKSSVKFTSAYLQAEVLWALILEPTYETANQYKRIGIAEICPGDSMFKGWTKREIQIV
ncbi:unnamed protein product [Sphagnum balticum]